MIGRAKVGLIVKWYDVIGKVENVKWECKHIEIGIRGDTGLDHLVTPDTGHPPALGELTVSMQMDPNFNCKATSAGNIWGKSIMSSWNVCLCEAWCCWGRGWGRGLELALQLSGFLCNEHIFNMSRISQYWDHKMKMNISEQSFPITRVLLLTHAPLGECCRELFAPVLFISICASRHKLLLPD